MTIETGYALLGAALALLIVLGAFAIFIGTLTTRALSYFGRFKGFQASRNARDEMSFGGVIDESAPPPPAIQLPTEEEQPATKLEALN